MEQTQGFYVTINLILMHDDLHKEIAFPMLSKSD